MHGRELRGKGGSHARTFILGCEWVEPQTGHPSPGVLCKGDKLPWPLGELLEQTERLEKPRLHS